jgi:hypothetical protein
LTDDGILAWMSHRWLRHCLTAIGTALEAAPTNPVNNDLKTWLETTREIPAHAARLRNFQKAAMWTKLRRSLPALFAAGTGVPFLAKTLTQEGAYVFVLFCFVFDFTGKIIRPTSCRRRCAIPTWKVGDD